MLEYNIPERALWKSKRATENSKGFHFMVGHPEQETTEKRFNNE